jgi:hypothetical protein
MSEPISAIGDSLWQIAQRVRGLQDFRVPVAAIADNREDLIIRTSIGRGTLESRKYLSLRGESFRSAQDRDGSWAGEYEIVVPLASLEQAPAPAVPPFNRPVGPIPHLPPQGFSKGTWTFGDGSSITVVGPALLLTAQTSTLHRLLWVSANQMITGGTNRFAQAQGTKTAAISIQIPDGTTLEDLRSFQFTSVDVFRVVRKEFIGTPPPPPGTPA